MTRKRPPILFSQVGRVVATVAVVAILALASAVAFRPDRTETARNTAPLRSAKVLEGKVARVIDGDTLTVVDGDRAQHRIRLDGIDAPESGQPYGTAARRALAKLALETEVRVEWTRRDQHDRILGRVYVGETDVNRRIVEQGLAWRFKYSDSRELAAAEESARLAKSGLWSRSDRIAPWDWRAGVRPPGTARSSR